MDLSVLVPPFSPFKCHVLTGGPFDPLGLASGEKAAGLKEAEIKHARLAMIAFLGECAFAPYGSIEPEPDWTSNCYVRVYFLNPKPLNLTGLASAIFILRKEKKN